MSGNRGENPPEADITITESAAVFFEEFANSQGKTLFPNDDDLDIAWEFVYLLIEVKAGGCSGFQYSLGLQPTTAQWNPLTEELLMSNGVTILVDSRSYEKIRGLVIDYKNDLMESGLTFTNPSATSTCGCNKSFR